MSSEREDSNAIWQSNNAMNWDESFDDFEISPQNEQDQVVSQDEVDTTEDQWSEPASKKMGAFKKVARQFSPVFIPLIFAGLTFLFMLPVELNGQPLLPLLAVASLLLAIAILQGTMLYFAGSNDGLWSLYIIVGFCLFLLIGCFTIFGQLVTLIVLAVLLFGAALLAQKCIRPVSEGYVDIVYSFGKYARTLSSGFNLIAPWENVQSQLNVRETLWTSPLQRVRLSRDSDVQFYATIAYQLIAQDAYLAALNVKDWEKSLHELFISTVQSVINDLSPQDFIAWPQGSRSRKSPDLSSADANIVTRWDKINKLLARRVQDQVATWGVQVNWVHIRDVTLLPHVASEVDTDAIGKARGMEAGVARGAVSAAAQPMQAKVFRRPEAERHEKPEAALHLSPPPPVQSASPASSVLHASAPVAATPTVPTGNEEALVEAYNAVRQGRITDPTTIRSIAQRFEAIANDPEHSKNVGFDAARAANVLYQRAQMHEEKMANERTGYDDETQADWQPPIQRPTNNNLMTGG